jgi:CspA family cold shock protein
MRTKGTVKFFDNSKGFGFIRPDDDGGKDVFVHVTAVQVSKLSGLSEGDRVSYVLEADKHGRPRAGQLEAA